MSLEELRQARHKTVGIKQTLKAVEAGQAEEVYLAADAEEWLVRPLREKCQEREVPVIPVPSMNALGQACGIEVGAAAAARLRQPGTQQ
ncbi:MAG: ribosomal L7Ae/L30e/S12e/Gadd45 family protein [Firmicutes bacterium]|nr:ribosomal L7Ae/L30e/S12e/Gadd45 family protein [Bacillota bacterium]